MKSRIIVAAALAFAITFVSTSSASATRTFPLRVEAPGTTLDPGTYYAPRSPIAGQRGELAGAGNCVGGKGDIPLAGQGALGLVASAANANPALRPTLIAEDGFGKRICRIGTFNETDTPFTGWLFRVNHVAPQLSADLVPLKGVDEVLWAFADFGSGANTGDELVLTAPAQNAPGTIAVQVQAISFDGNVTPAPDGTVITGGTSLVTTTGGSALVPVASGFATLRATGPGAVPKEIASSPVKICAFANPADCPPVAGRTIVGTDLPDRFKGTAGPDAFRTRGGKDRVFARNGGTDTVNCGKGKDIAVIDASDKAQGCEKVRRPS